MIQVIEFSGNQQEDKSRVDQLQRKAGKPYILFSREEEEWAMKKNILPGLLVLFFGAACATSGGMGERQKPVGNIPPVVTQSFASERLQPGDTWKIYLNAMDPEGAMRYIVATVDQPGVGEYAASFTRIPRGEQKNLSGYVYLNTYGPNGYEFLNFSYITLTLEIQDEAGNYSKPAVFTVHFNTRYTQQPPPAGLFKDKKLGAILITLHGIEEDRGPGSRNP